MGTLALSPDRRRRGALQRWVVVVGLLVASLTGCTSGSGQASPTTVERSSTSTSPSTAPTTARPAPTGPSRVVFLLLDELPETSLLDGGGRVDRSLFPNFARLAEDSTWYRNTTTVAPYTQLAVPAVLTGNYPRDSDPTVDPATFPNSLFTFLGPAYEMNVHESATDLCPVELCPVQGVEDFDHALVAGEDFVRSLQASDAPRLDFLHLLMPHQPWHYLPTGQDYLKVDPAEGAPRYSWTTDHGARAAKQRHLLQLQVVDDLLGRILDRLTDLGVYDDSLVVLTADHGAAFSTGDSIRGASEDSYQDVAWTPLLVKGRGQTTGEVDDLPVQSIDVLPTVADELDRELPWPVDGRSTLGPRRAEGPRPLYEWVLNGLDPAEGEDYVQLPGPEGFARVLRARAWPGRARDELRLYRVGPYGDQVGRRIGATTSPRDGTYATIDVPETYADVDRDAVLAPWAYLSGRFSGPHGTPLAITVNGTIAAICEADQLREGLRQFWTVLPPAFVLEGRNEIGVYVIRGSDGAPEFEPVTLAG